MGHTNSYRTPTGKENQFIEVYMYYDLGGPGIFSGSEIKRGMHLMVHPITVEDGFKRFGAYQGFRSFRKPMKRKNKKELEYAEKWVEKNHEAVAKGFMANGTRDDGMWKIIDTYGT